VLQSFLTRCSFKVPHSPFDTTFYVLAVQESERRGVTAGCKGADKYFNSSLKTGVSIATMSYNHIENRSIQMLVCLFTAGATYIDDTNAADPEDRRNVEKFSERFITGEVQPDPFHALFAGVMRDMYNHFGRIAANSIVSAGLNFCNSVLLEICSKELNIVSTEPEYALFYRNMSGAPDAYTFFIFPPTMPISIYIQAFPDIIKIVNHANDILSFYKEETTGDDVNCVSLVATSRKISKLEALGILIDECVAAHQNAVKIITPCKEALEIYHKWMQGYLAFHVYAERYRLNELGLWC
ncbi:terpenoid synthase, partial [Dendrothele bispora CBS 962.96]